MLRNLSRTAIVLTAFVLGFLSAFLVVALVTFVISTNYSLRELEENTAFPTISEQYIGEYPEVYIRDMSLVEMLKEGKELAAMGDELTLNLMISRYDLLLPEKAEIFLTPVVRDLPLNHVFSEEGLKTIMSTVYIGEFRGYERREIDGETVWYNPINETEITGINRIISELTLSQAISGEFSFASMLDNVTIGEALGYELVDGVYHDSNGNEVTGIIGVVCGSNINNVSERINDVELADVFGYKLVDGIYYDENGEKVTGIMSVMCDTTIKGVPDRINSATFSEVLGYELDENGVYWDNGTKVSGVMAVIADCTVSSAPDKINNVNMGEILGFTYDEEASCWVDSEGNPVDGLMNKVSSKKITELDGITDELVLSDVISDEDRVGLVSFIPADTGLDEIPTAVDKAFNEHSLRDFIEEDIIQFSDSATETAEQKKEKFLEKSVADYTIPQIIDLLYSLPDAAIK